MGVKWISLQQMILSHDSIYKLSSRDLLSREISQNQKSYEIFSQAKKNFLAFDPLVSGTQSSKKSKFVSFICQKFDVSFDSNWLSLDTILIQFWLNLTQLWLIFAQFWLNFNSAFYSIRLSFE